MEGLYDWEYGAGREKCIALRRLGMDVTLMLCLKHHIRFIGHREGF